MPLLTEAELLRAAERWGALLPPGAVVYLEGELGAGKTTAVRAIARGLGVAEVTSSPTYALVHRYAGRRGPVFHLDCYRLRTPDEAADLDWAGIAAEMDALLVEWPERAAGWAPPPTHRVRFAHAADADRREVAFA